MKRAIGGIGLAVILLMSLERGYAQRGRGAAPNQAPQTGRAGAPFDPSG